MLGNVYGFYLVAASASLAVNLTGQPKTKSVSLNCLKSDSLSGYDGGRDEPQD